MSYKSKRNNIKSILIMAMVLMFSSTVSATAQRIVRLTVLENGTEQPVVSAVVTYADNEAMQNPRHAVTDTEGTAKLELTSGNTAYYYKVDYVGFVPATGIIKPEDSAKSIYMKEDVLGLNEVVITGSQTARPLKLSAVTTQVLGGKQLGEAG